MRKKWLKHLILFIIGGLVYILIEVIWRTIMGSTPTHWAMFFIGGFIFLILGGINERIPWEFSLVRQCGIGTAVILTVEFISGCILNLWLGLGIWDYSDKAFNLLGQVCPQFALAWFFVSGIGIILDDYLRYWLFGEDKPKYTLINIPKKKKKRKKKIEFSKILVTWALILTTICVAMSYILSLLDRDPASDVTVAVATTCIAIGVGYQAKSFGEKNSRNKYRVSEYGQKIETDSSDDEAVG